MRLDDFVCLGRTVPEDSKKYGRKVCMAGYSEELRGLVRVYPLPVVNPIRQRSMCQLELSRPCHDNRPESWRLARESSGSGITVKEPEVHKERVLAWLEDNRSESIAQLNARRASLGVVEAAEIQPKFKGAPDVAPEERGLFDDVEECFGEPPAMVPYIRFRDVAGWHQLQVREWGCHEWLRKEPGKAGQLWDNLRLGRDDMRYLFVVGNMCNHRKAWLIISVYKSVKEQPLFPPGSFT